MFGKRSECRVLQRFSMIPKGYALEKELTKIAAKQGWLKKR